MNKFEHNPLNTYLFNNSVLFIEYIHTRNYESFIENFLREYFIEHRISRYVELELNRLGIDTVAFDETLTKVYLLWVYMDRHQYMPMPCHENSCLFCSADRYKNISEEQRKEINEKMRSYDGYYDEVNKVNLGYVSKLIEFISQNNIITPLDKLDLPASLKEDYALILNKLFETNDIKLAEKELGYWQDTIPSDMLQKVLLLLRYDYLNYLKINR